MENYKKIIKKRMHLAAGFNCLLFIFISFTGYRQDVMAIVSGNISDMIRGFQTGVFIGLQLFMVIFITKYRKAIKSEDSLKKLYIEENDERKN